MNIFENRKVWADVSLAVIGLVVAVVLVVAGPGLVKALLEEVPPVPSEDEFVSVFAR